MVDSTRGVLYPARLPEFHRLPAPPEISDLAVWFWIPEWDVQPGRTSRQEVVAYPALNLVIEQGGVSLVGATTRATHRDLTGRGWAVGALLRPAAVAALTESPASVIDQEVALTEPELHDAVAAAMTSGDGHRERAVALFARWLLARVGEPTDAARQANGAADLLMTTEVRSPEEVAARLSVSVRTLQRLMHRHVGLPPAAMIRCRRLQEAAERVRTDPSADLATIAAEFGYSDHAHLTTDFRTVLGFTPSAYRAASHA
ncbi:MULTISPECIES: helix-turn-helix domain-containing protein [unclassified Microbacterium]|uniref:helix-turn-helix domain-containing protein n=1 Tax=unclassified Microbacterium TaxID=2609290 RepID=UPI0012F81207|nr:helix-turn-helix domain-containing protein [Microbacterium sp. MAH-37]MVQ42008.1 helix-turn-helix domain-containing protein [Microbacterium sp. MAH-37]